MPSFKHLTLGQHILGQFQRIFFDHARFDLTSAVQDCVPGHLPHFHHGTHIVVLADGFQSVTIS
jgi:hypothetical protein